MKLHVGNIVHFVLTQLVQLVQNVQSCYSVVTQSMFKAVIFFSLCQVLGMSMSQGEKMCSQTGARTRDTSLTGRVLYRPSYPAA